MSGSLSHAHTQRCATAAAATALLTFLLLMSSPRCCTGVAYCSFFTVYIHIKCAPSAWTKSLPREKKVSLVKTCLVHVLMQRMGFGFFNPVNLRFRADRNAVWQWDKILKLAVILAYFGAARAVCRFSHSLTAWHPFESKDAVVVGFISTGESPEQKMLNSETHVCMCVVFFKTCWHIKQNDYLLSVDQLKYQTDLSQSAPRGREKTPLSFSQVWFLLWNKESSASSLGMGGYWRVMADRGVEPDFNSGCRE